MSAPRRSRPPLDAALAFAATVFAATGAAPAQAPERAAPLHAWDFSSAAWAGTKLEATAGPLAADLGAPPRFDGRGAWIPGTGIAIDGVAPSSLPSEALTVEALVSIDRGTRWGGIAGFAQDNGAFERGWQLGYNETRFSFWVSTGGPMIEVVSPAPFEPGRTHHLAGAFDGGEVRLYVDGEEVAAATAEGRIAYPEVAYYTLGTYRDENEYYPMEGALTSVRLYDRALSSEQIAGLAAEADVKTTPAATAPVQPMLRFTAPGTAALAWVGKPATVHFGDTKRLGQTADGRDDGRGGAIATLAGLRPETIYFYRVGDGPVHEFDTALNFAKPRVPGAADPVAAERARHLLERAEIDRGYALVWGTDHLPLALELARAGGLSVVVAARDPEAAAAARRALYEGGAHGSRATVLELDPAAHGYSLPLSSGTINLAVLPARDALPEAELVRLLVPGRGRALSLAEAEAAWSLAPPPVPGAGGWSHQYGDPGNSAASDDPLGGATATGDFAVAWVGRPGADFGIDRNPRMPAPVSAGGRLFHQGMERVAALDAANGALLWSAEIPGLRRLNIPRDCSNWCAGEAELFVAVGGRAYALDAETGARRRHFDLAPAELAGAGRHAWGYIAHAGEADMLLGSAVDAKSSYNDFWGKQMWFDGKAGEAGTEQVCSDALFAYALNSAGGEPAWTYRRGLILNPSICAADGRVYFVETRNPELLDGAKRRRLGGDALWREQFLVALDTRTGERLWERAIDLEDGGASFYLQASAGRLVAVASNTQYHLYAFDAADGRPLWSRSAAWPDDHHSGHIQHPVLMGDALYLQPNGYHAATGEPFTAKVGAREGCHTYVGAGGALLYRGQDRRVALWDRERETVTTWPRLRPSCWLSTIPASGMLLMPEAGGGCSCGGWMETSLGFIPRARLSEGNLEGGAAPPP